MIHRCKYCVYSTHDKSNFNKHMQKNHKSKEQTSSSSVSQAPRKKEHVSNNDPAIVLKKGHICDQCGKCLSTKYGLKLHIKNFHEKIFKHICPTCNKGFNQFVQFSFHCKRHLDIVPEQCEYCGTQFTSPGSLTRHLKICKENPNHEELNGYVCSICAAVYNTEARLKEHIQGKHGPPKYKCPECDKRFSWRSSLKCHMKCSHRGQRLFVASK